MFGCGFKFFRRFDLRLETDVTCTWNWVFCSDWKKDTAVDKSTVNKVFTQKLHLLTATVINIFMSTPIIWLLFSLLFLTLFTLWVDSHHFYSELIFPLIMQAAVVRDLEIFAWYFWRKLVESKKEVQKQKSKKTGDNSSIQSVVGLECWQDACDGLKKKHDDSVQKLVFIYFVSRRGNFMKSSIFLT